MYRDGKDTDSSWIFGLFIFLIVLFMVAFVGMLVIPSMLNMGLETWREFFCELDEGKKWDLLDEQCRPKVLEIYKNANRQ